MSGCNYFHQKRPPSPDFPNRTNFVIARVCAFARPSEAFGGAHDENSSKHDGYHIN